MDSNGDETGEEYTQYCVMGALAAVNGKGELLAGSILQQVVSGKAYMDECFLYKMDVDLPKSAISVLVDEAVDIDKFKGAMLGYIPFDASDGWHGLHNVEEVQTFNDADKTTLADVHALIDFGIKQAEALVKRTKLAKGKPLSA